MSTRIDAPLDLLNGLTPSAFMRRHWQKKPLLIRQAIAGFKPPVDQRALFELASREGVESRLIARSGESWKVRHGPFGARALPPRSRPAWTLLVQGVDLHVDAAHALLQRFRFVPDARLDDLMISWASDGGGVGPHFDSYDVFLLQATGRRRWRIGRQTDLSLREGVPLKILSHFVPEQEFVLEPGDMLYLPPRWAHDGDAIGGDCMTCSIGFRAPNAGGLAEELLQRLADDIEDGRLYVDPSQPATESPARMPPGLRQFAMDALQRALAQPQSLDLALGEVLTEPKPSTWFDEPSTAWVPGGLHLDRRTRMMYDDRHVFINGEGFRAGGADARLMRKLADQRALSGRDVLRSSEGAQALLKDWFDAGWVRLAPDER
ncbi:MAG: cupin domain-containing protein [Hydrogenophaga sp.]|uniref:cupin domain-containing protein n=1 Tax=Hydrogenophaga sp. TaxID=1904254 RepID=UPI001D5F8F88|nr:cupin domain-containing protein [Hydrogenophaga sp.]MBX3609973.1 cupin domain-containing protein [Hydrogenophaga sp.]